MAKKVSRYKLRNSDRSGFKFYEIELIRDDGFLVAGDEYDTPPPSNKSLGGEGEVSGDPRQDSDFTITDTETEVNPNPTYYFATIDTASIVDSSSNSHTITKNGDANVSLDQFKVGVGSLKLDGDGDYLTIPDSSTFDFTGGVFTIEAWVMSNSQASQSIFFKKFDDTNNFNFFFDTNRRFQINVISDGSVTVDLNTGAISANSLGTWVHAALVENGSEYKIYINGSNAATLSSSNRMFASTGGVFIGRRDVSTGFQYFNGFLDELRVSTSARYLSNFTPSTTPYTSDNSTSLLTHFEPTGVSLSPDLNHPWMQISGSNGISQISTVLPGQQNDQLTLLCVDSAVRLSDGGGLDLKVPYFNMTSGSSINLFFDSSNSVWRETSRFRP